MAYEPLEILSTAIHSHNQAVKLRKALVEHVRRARRHYTEAQDKASKDHSEYFISEVLYRGVLSEAEHALATFDILFEKDIKPIQISNDD